MAEFKEFKRRFKFKLKIVLNVSRFKSALNLNRVLADFGGFKPRLKFFKFHLLVKVPLFENKIGRTLFSVFGTIFHFDD